MQKVLTAAQMREVDRLTTERYGIPSIILMENAAHAVARVITEKLGGSVKGKSILILCGPGNNGGDGAGLARILWKDGADVAPLLFGRVEDTSGDARTNFDVLKAIDEDVAVTGGEFNKLLLHESGEDLIPMVEGWLNDPRPKIVVDALFGTGLQRPLGGEFLEVIQRLVNHQPEVVAIDIPSGLDSDVSEPIGCSITATTTVTFTAPKVANVLAPAAGFNGELIVANIGSPTHLVDEQPSQLFVTEPFDVRHWLERSEFTPESYKNKRGHALLIAGSKDYTGAAVLAGDAAIRSGCGLVTLVVPESSRESVVARVVPEVMVRGISETDEGSAADQAFDEITGFLKNVDAIAIGSGMSTNEETRAFVRRMVDERAMPMVVDADGLTALSPLHAHRSAASGDAGGSPAVQSPLILTPHEGEFMRLLGTDDKDVIKDRVAAVRDLSTKHNVILVLKGERVLIGAPDGRVIVNPTGNSGLGKAGNGDTLTGILIGFIAQAVRMKIDLVETVVAACYVAGMAGDVAEKKYGKRVMTASDVRECLVDVFDSLEGALKSSSPEETFALGEKLAAELRAGDVVLLCGELGAGKTLLTKGILSGLDFDVDEVTSPSFALVNLYKTAGFDVYHIDLWRVGAGNAGDAVGLDEIVESDNAVTIIEWADRLVDAKLAGRTFKIEIKGEGDEQRIISIQTAEANHGFSDQGHEAAV